MDKKVSNRSTESTWHVVRRCLTVLNRLQIGAASKQELLKTIYMPDSPKASIATLNKRFDNDKIRLWEHLGVRVCYDRQAKGYVIAEWERPLLNLSDNNLTILAFLSDTFQSDAPRGLEVAQLIDQLISWLPEERQKRFRWASGQQATADLRLRDSEPITADVWKIVHEAWQAKQELRFDYLSSQHDDGQPREHHVQPWDLDFTDRGHWRLRGYCLFNDGPNGPWHPNTYFNYRVSRIIPDSAQVLPRKLPPIRPNGRPLEVIFELSPQIARFGVSQRRELIDPPTLMELDEGWVRVTGKTHDVFDLARNLLYYGRHCRVLGGQELLREMRGLVSGLAEIYQ
ncbi:MAG: WYL domain-containing protein [Chloroflexota bacterium]